MNPNYKNLSPEYGGVFLQSYASVTVLAVLRTQYMVRVIDHTNLYGESLCLLYGVQSASIKRCGASQRITEYIVVVFN